MAEEVSREDFDSVVQAVSDVVSEFRPGLSLQTVERTYRAWKSELNLICEVETYPGSRLLWRGVVSEPAGWEEARKRALEEMLSIGGGRGLSPATRCACACRCSRRTNLGN